MPQKIEKMQLCLLEKAKRYLQDREKFKSMYYVANSKNYLNAWAADTLGYLNLKCLNENKVNYKRFLGAYIRNFIYLGYQRELFFETSCKLVGNKHVIVSWCNENDFLEDGSFQCKYFNCNSKDINDVLWVLISLDNCIPVVKKNNITIFRKRQSKKFSTLAFFENLFFCLWNRMPFAVESFFAKKFSDMFLDKICIKDLEQLILPYEAQPWQHMLSLTLRNKNKNICIIGDLHSCLPPLPTDFIKRYGAPNKVLVHGQGQKDIMENLLGWSKEEIEVVPSRRFLIESHDTHLVNKILLPYGFEDSEFLLKKLQVFFKHYEKELPLLGIRNHPTQTNSQKHKNLMQGIIKLQNMYSDGANHAHDKVSIVMGASSVIIECLTRGIKVFQIVENPIFETYGSLIWKNIQVKYMDKNIVAYGLCKNANYLEFGNNNLQKVFSND